MRDSNEQRLEDKSCANTNSNDNIMVNNEDKYIIDYSIVEAEKYADMRASVVKTKAVHNEFKDVFMGNGCFQGTFSLQVKDDTKQY